jgi:hypothetical protein
LRAVVHDAAHWRKAAALAQCAGFARDDDDAIDSGVEVATRLIDHHSAVVHERVPRHLHLAPRSIRGDDASLRRGNTSPARGWEALSVWRRHPLGDASDVFYCHRPRGIVTVRARDVARRANGSLLATTRAGDCLDLIKVSVGDDGRCVGSDVSDPRSQVSGARHVSDVRASLARHGGAHRRLPRGTHDVARGARRDRRSGAVVPENRGGGRVRSASSAAPADSNFGEKLCGDDVGRLHATRAGHAVTVPVEDVHVTRRVALVDLINACNAARVVRWVLPATNLKACTVDRDRNVVG